MVLFKPILHYALGLCFGKICEQKRKKDVKKYWRKRNVKCNIETFSRVFDTNMLQDIYYIQNSFLLFIK